ncbi:hypothetical protein OB955_22045 [Halobacteria archaeon AArc-m2/3/4]|uniref:dTMP kinase n=1 Tax=Natronoglomus mannanivorans TaxID=2979990 RepID=A0ABT2QKB6_9EURY|nr:hypothetical protein [Halobacteria archaeon AArc-m2/3/4]
MKTKIIVITGIDGTGKTTQSEYLKNFLNKECDKTATKSHQFASGPIMKQIMLKHGELLKKLERGTSSNNENSNRKRPLSDLLTLMAALRILSTGVSHTWTRIIKNKKSEFIVFDRYFYDVLIKLSWMYDIDVSRIKVFEKLVPKPDLILVLDSPGEIALERETDDDLTLEQMTNKRETYKEYFNNELETTDKYYKLDTSNQNISEVKSNIRKIVQKELIV